ncbi:MAG: esterase/lipase family protein [Thermoanaerobacteraceae bacterium]
MDIPLILIPGIFGSVYTPTPLGKIWSFGPAGYVYNPFVDNLKNLGFIEDKNLFICYYEWWKSVPDSINTLIDVINTAKLKTKTNKVNLLCHSMGGLLARAYIQSDIFNNDVDKVIFLASPHLGAANAYYGWEGATVPPDNDDFVNILFKGFLWAFSKMKGETDAVRVIREYIPSVKDLLPSLGYENYLFKYTANNSRIIFKNISYMKEQNIFLNNLNNNQDDFYKKIKHIFCFSGDGIFTNKFIQVEETDNDKIWPDGKPVGIIRDEKGDGTVLRKSAFGIMGEQFIIKSSHVGILNESLQDLSSILGLREKPKINILEKIFSYVSILTDKKVMILDRSNKTKSYDLFGELTWHFASKPKGEYEISILQPGISNIYIQTNKQTISKRINTAKKHFRSIKSVIEIDEEGNFELKER